MRPRKNPGIRQEAFIRAATELFMEKGYEAVSIRDVLDAVGDKTASPSVFYYYFKSKDSLYQACVQAVGQDYIKTMESAFSAEGKSLDQWFLSLVSGVESYLQEERLLIMTGSSTANRLFVLDMRDQVTKRISELWAESLEKILKVPEKEARHLATFISGGIGEMLFEQMTKGSLNRKEVSCLTDGMVRFSMNAIGLPEQRRQELLKALETRDYR